MSSYIFLSFLTSRLCVVLSPVQSSSLFLATHTHIQTAYTKTKTKCIFLPTKLHSKDMSNPFQKNGTNFIEKKEWDTLTLFTNNLIFECSLLYMYNTQYPSHHFRFSFHVYPRAFFCFLSCSLSLCLASISNQMVIQGIFL